SECPCNVDASEPDSSWVGARPVMSCRDPFQPDPLRLDRRTVLASGLLLLGGAASGRPESFRGKKVSRTPYPPVAEYPNLVLTNGELALTVVLPDAKRGFYRGTRFDWSGQVARAAYRGHTLFAPWKSPHDPENYEDAIGTAEEFGINAPVGYDTAR